MKLGEFLTNVPKSTAKKEPVEFTILGRDGSANQVETTAHACFALVTDKDHEEGDLAALKSMRETQTELGIIPSSVLGVRERAQFLSAALRDFDNPIERFADADGLQRHLARRELERLEREYHIWAEKNYPSRITKEDRDKLKGEARGK